MKVTFRKAAVEHYQRNTNVYFVDDEMSGISLWRYLIILLLSMIIYLSIYYNYIPQAEDKTLTCHNDKEVTLSYLVKELHVSILRADDTTVDVAAADFINADKNQLCLWGGY
ncbi:MAG: hypothetical protein ACI9J4_001620 [Paraglaciecola sp.]|jgi:hypothetical protein